MNPDGSYHPSISGAAPIHLSDMLKQAIGPEVLSRKWLEFEGGVISGLLLTKAGVGAPGGDHAMRTHSTTPADETKLFLGDGW